MLNVSKVMFEAGRQGIIWKCFDCWVKTGTFLHKNPKLPICYVFTRAASTLSGIEDDIGKIFQKFRIFSEKYAQSLNDPLGIPQQFPILRGGQK